MKFRHKPVVVEAIEFTGKNAVALSDWCTGSVSIQRTKNEKCIVIHTLEGAMRADVGDWIIKGIMGEFYPIKDEIFRATYEKVED